MNARGKRYVSNKYISLLVLVGLISLLGGVVIVAHPFESIRLPNNAGHSVSAAQLVTDSTSEQENTNSHALISNPNANPGKWTVMIYIDADDSSLEEQSISDFLEMANVGSNEYVNVVVQLDRTPEDDNSYSDWADCRRFLITKGLTPANGSEAVNIGEVNMGDPDTLVSFVEWAAYNYPAEKYALILSGHGKGWLGCCWDETSGNDNLNLGEIHSALSDISTLIGRPLDILGFDACLMSMTEVVYGIHDYASVMIASENAEPTSGWPYDTILTQLAETPEMDAAQLATSIVDNYYTSHMPTGYTMTAIDLTKIDTLVGTLNDLAQALVVYADSNIETIKQYAGSTMTALDNAVIYEKHGTRWSGSHGLAIYFPTEQSTFDPAYNADTVSLADNTAWEEFLIGSFTYTGDNWITSDRSETQQYYCKEYVDLYDFCQKLIGD
jgi:hypothetical protein